MRAPVRLAREIPAVRHAGGAVLIGVVLTVLGGVGLMLERSLAARTGQSEWLAQVVGTGFLLVGLLMLFFAIKMVLITRLPETIVEVDRMPVRAGTPFQVTVRQPGPIRLESLRVNVVGEQITKRRVWRNGRTRTNTDRHLIHQDNIIDVRSLAIARGEEVIRQGDATVPAEITLVDLEGNTTVVWRLEVWGRVLGWVNFGHPFVITVSGGKATYLPDEEP